MTEAAETKGLTPDCQVCLRILSYYIYTSQKKKKKKKKRKKKKRAACELSKNPV